MRFASPVDIPATRGSFYSCLPILGQFSLQAEQGGTFCAKKRPRRRAGPSEEEEERTRAAGTMEKALLCAVLQDIAQIAVDQLDAVLPGVGAVDEEAVQTAHKTFAGGLHAGTR